MTTVANQSGNYTPIGACPHCGAPLYAQSTWGGILPPPVMYSCTCRLGNYELIVSPNTLQGHQEAEALTAPNPERMNPSTAGNGKPND